MICEAILKQTAYVIPNSGRHALSRSFSRVDQTLDLQHYSFYWRAFFLKAIQLVASIFLQVLHVCTHEKSFSRIRFQTDMRLMYFITR